MTNLLFAIIQRLAIPVLIAAALMIFYLSYLLLWPIRVVELTHSPIHVLDTAIRPGEELHYVLDYCKYSDVPATVQFNFVGEHTVPTLASYRSLPLRCPGQQVLSVIIPLSTPPGRYKIAIINTYRVNPIRSVTNTWLTEEFTVTR